MGRVMKYLLLGFLLISTQVFANIKLSGNELLNSIDRSQLSQAQIVLLDRALTQEKIEVIEVTEHDLVQAFKSQELKPIYKLRMRHIKRWLKTTDHKATCLDEYLQQRKKQMRFPVVLLIDTGLGITVAALSGGWIPTLTVSFAFMRFFLSETIAGRIMRLRYPDAILGSWNPYEFDAIANSISVATLVPYYLVAISSTVKAANTNLIMKTIANTKGFHSKHIYKFQKKYLKAYPEDRELATIERLKDIVNEADTFGLLCDGSIVKQFSPRRYRKGVKLKQRLARKKELFQYIHSQL